MNSHRGWGMVQPSQAGPGQLLAQPGFPGAFTAVLVSSRGGLRSRGGRIAAHSENFIAPVPWASSEGTSKQTKKKKEERNPCKLETLLFKPAVLKSD